MNGCVTGQSASARSISSAPDDCAGAGANIHLVPLDAAFEYPEEVPQQIASDPKYLQVAAEVTTTSNCTSN